MNDFFKKYHSSLDFKIYIIEQTPEKLFNRAKLLNIGYDQAKDYCDYICLHDVDMLPEDESCDYSYSNYPKQLATYLSRYDYKTLIDRKTRAGQWSVLTHYWGGVTIELYKRPDVLVPN